MGRPTSNVTLRATLNEIYQLLISNENEHLKFIDLF